MTSEYLVNGRKEAEAKMEAARTVRDSAKSKKAYNSAYDDFLFWQDKVAFYVCELKALEARL